MRLIKKIHKLFGREPIRRTSFRPGVESLEQRWCPSSNTFHWSAAAAGNWNTQGDWQIWNPQTSQWNNTNQTPTSGDTAEFDGTSTQLCTVTTSVTVGQLNITVSGNGSDQIKINSGVTLAGKLAWNVDGVQINFAATDATLEALSGSSIQSFKFDGAKGVFQIIAGGGSLTWSTSADSNTTAQIQIVSGTFDVKNKGFCTSTFGGADVWVQPTGVLKYDYSNNDVIADVFDNNADGAGYIFVGQNSAGSLGTVTTSANTFTAFNDIPLRDNGSVTVDTAKLEYFRSVAGAAGTEGVSYYESAGTYVNPNTILKNSATLYADSGFRMDAGDLNVADGTTVTVESGLSGDNSVLIYGGTIGFPSGTTYGTLDFQLPTSSSVQFAGGAVTMKVDPTTTNGWKGDKITTNGRYFFPANNSATLTINNSGTGGALTGNWVLMASGTAKSGTWSGVTDNIAGTSTQWDGTNKNFSVSK